MKTKKISNAEINFKAKVSPKFESFMRNYLSQGGKRIKNNMLLNSRIANFEKYGYDEYTVNLTTKYISWGNEYSLVVTKEGQKLSEGACIATKNSAKNIVFYFLYMKKQLFKSLMQRKGIMDK